MEAGKVMLLPRGLPTNGSPLRLDLSNIYRAENRLYDLAVVSPGSAPEFMAEMNAAAHMAMNYVSEITAELILARQAKDKRKAILILEILPEKLKEKGLKPNEDIREAIMSLDQEYMSLRDRVECLEAASIHLDNKVKTFVRAFNASRSILERKSSIALDPNTSIGSKPFDVKEKFAGHSINTEDTRDVE